MFECHIFYRQRSSAYLFCLSVMLLIAFTTGCGDNASHQPHSGTIPLRSSGTGSATISIQWHSAAHQRSSDQVLLERQAIPDCQSVGVETITCEVYDESGNPIAASEHWPCASRSGRMDRIPAGPNRIFTILGWDASRENILYQGQTPTGIPINPGEISDAGRVDAYPFVPIELAANGNSNSRIDLAWNMSSNMTAAGYRIYRDNILHDTSPTTTYSDTLDLNPSTQYCYAVSAYDAFGNESGKTDVVCATTNDNNAPIVNISAPENGTISRQGDAVTFSGTAEDTEDGELTGQALVWTSSIDGQIGTGPSITFNGLSTGTHTITLTATDSDGAIGATAISISINTGDNVAPTDPTNLSGLPRGGARIDLSWDASTDNVGVAGYRIFRDSVEVGTSETTSYSDTGLTSTTQYCYTVSAYDAANNPSGQSNRVCVTTEDTIPPTAPTGLTVTPVSFNQLDLAWSAATDNVGVSLYRIYQDGVLMDSTSSTSYRVAGLSAATRYCFTVSAVDSAGNPSGRSNEACAATTPTTVSILFLNLFIDIEDQAGDGYTRLAAYLRALGFVVTQSNLTVIADAGLSDHQIVVFGGDLNRGINVAEAGVIRRFVEENGGGLLLLGDQGVSDYTPTLRRDLNLVTDVNGESSWGIGFEANLLCDDEDYCSGCATNRDPDGGVDYPIIRPTISHPSTNGVGAFVYNWGASLAVNRNIARIVADSSSASWRDLDATYAAGIDEFHCRWDDSEPRGAYPAMAVVEPGQGRVVAIGDSGMWFNVFFEFNVTGTQELARSVFTYLSGP